MGDNVTFYHGRNYEMSFTLKGLNYLPRKNDSVINPESGVIYRVVGICFYCDKKLNEQDLYDCQISVLLRKVNS